MGYLPSSKFGNCTQCDATNTACVKIQKSLVCLQCNRKNKGKQQIEKAKLRDKVRGLSHSEANKEIIATKDVELELWFIRRSKELTGKCKNCGGKTCKGDLKYWKYSIAHILPKSIFKSVATHELNFLELCHFGESCHANADNNGYEYVKDKMPVLWKLMIARIKIMFPSIREKSKLPDVIINEINMEDYEQ